MYNLSFQVIFFKRRQIMFIYIHILVYIYVIIVQLKLTNEKNLLHNIHSINNQKMIVSGEYFVLKKKLNKKKKITKSK